LGVEEKNEEEDPITTHHEAIATDLCVPYAVSSTMLHTLIPFLPLRFESFSRNS